MCALLVAMVLVFAMSAAPARANTATANPAAALSSSAPAPIATAVALQPTPSPCPSATAAQTGNGARAEASPAPCPSATIKTIAVVATNGRKADLIGIAGAASEGAIGPEEIAARPILRPGELLEAIPGLVISQHSGEGKANQYYLRGFQLDLDVTYYYNSWLPYDLKTPGNATNPAIDPALGANIDGNAGVADYHFHPATKRVVRVTYAVKL